MQTNKSYELSKSSIIRLRRIGYRNGFLTGFTIGLVLGFILTILLILLNSF